MFYQQNNERGDEERGCMIEKTYLNSSSLQVRHNRGMLAKHGQYAGVMKQTNTREENQDECSGSQRDGAGGGVS